MHARAVRADVLTPRAALLAALALGACSGGGGPTNIELTIARLEIASNTCALGVIEGDTCSILVRAFAPDGTQIGRPVLRWFSGNPAIAEVDRSGGAVQTRSPGQTTITITNTTASVSVEAAVFVVRDASKALDPAAPPSAR